MNVRFLNEHMEYLVLYIFCGLSLSSIHIFLLKKSTSQFKKSKLIYILQALLFPWKYFSFLSFLEEKVKIEDTGTPIVYFKNKNLLWVYFIGMVFLWPIKILYCLIAIGGKILILISTLILFIFVIFIHLLNFIFRGQKPDFFEK